MKKRYRIEFNSTYIEIDEEGLDEEEIEFEIDKALDYPNLDWQAFPEPSKTAESKQ